MFSHAHRSHEICELQNKFYSLTEPATYLCDKHVIFVVINIQLRLLESYKRKPDFKYKWIFFWFIVHFKNDHT